MVSSNVGQDAELKYEAAADPVLSREEVNNLITASVMRRAGAEIRDLRRQNELLAAKVEVLDVFKAALSGQPPTGVFSFGADITYELDRIAAKLEGKPDPNDIGTAEAGVRS